MWDMEDWKQVERGERTRKGYLTIVREKRRREKQKNSGEAKRGGRDEVLAEEESVKGL
jgi:hypothetical protein